MTFHDPRAVLKAHGLWTKKRFGQNFLIAPQVPERIVRVGGARANDVVFEIGAGCGTLTRALAPEVSRVIALEYDRDLVPVARAELGWADHVEIREGNVLDVDWDAIRTEFGVTPIVYGNLPYHLSSKIILSLIAHPTTWSRACFMLQKEFAQRLAATPGTRQSSALSVQAALWSVTTHAFDVPANCFHPAPKVESSVIVMERRETPAADVGDEARFKSVVRALFAQRRKMARKALKSISDDVDDLLTRASLDGTCCGETFTLDEIAALSRALIAQSQESPGG
jgi:16S rRNA (adenine1518-N6/adenine1519-N6)-dimethyltransferase